MRARLFALKTCGKSKVKKRKQVKNFIGSVRVIGSLALREG